MGDPMNPVAEKRPKPPLPVRRPPIRAWSMDDIVVAVFAFLGIGGAVFFPLRFDNFSPTITSFLLATGLAALTYRYLGGIQGASFTVGTLKLGGALAALVGIAMLIHHTMVSDPPPPRFQTWEVSGQVTNESGQPVAPLLDQANFAVFPSTVVPTPDAKFKLNVFSQLDENGNMTFPTLQIAYPKYLPANLDLNQGAQHDMDIKWVGHRIVIQQIKLHPDLAPLNPQQSLHKISDGSVALPASPEANP